MVQGFEEYLDFPSVLKDKLIIPLSTKKKKEAQHFSFLWIGEISYQWG